MKREVKITLTIPLEGSFDLGWVKERLTPSRLMQLVRDAFGEFQTVRGYETFVELDERGLPVDRTDLTTSSPELGVERYVQARYPGFLDERGVYRTPTARDTFNAKVREVLDRCRTASLLKRSDITIEWPKEPFDEAR